MDGWMGEWMMDGSMDGGWMDRWTDRRGVWVKVCEGDLFGVLVPQLKGLLEHKPEQGTAPL